MSAWWYWALFGVAVVIVICGPYVLAAWRDANEARDREAWDARYGSRR